MNDEERVLWRRAQAHRDVQCVLRSCCAGAELQLRIRRDVDAEPSVVLRELYPTKSDLYERARQLEREYGEDLR